MTPAEMFQTEFRRRTPAFALRLAEPDDASFLRRLFHAVEAPVMPLPPALLDLQYDSRQQAYAAQFPQAMEVVAERDGRPIGHMMIDWDGPDGACGVDLAVLPDERAGAAGLHLLRAWIAVADRLARPAVLSVRPGSPVIGLYRRLGFVAVDAQIVPIRMKRPMTA